MTKRRRGLEEYSAIWNRPMIIGNNYWQYKVWKDNLPANLRRETKDYDLYGAFLSGAKPTLEADGLYHLPSRDPRNGRILKSPFHPTFRQALEEDHKLGYEPVWHNGEVYTIKRDKKLIGGDDTTPRRGNGGWSDQVRLTDKGLEGRRGNIYYFDEDGNAVDVSTGRKGHIRLDETYVTPASGTISEKEQNEQLEKLGLAYHYFSPNGDVWINRQPKTSSTSIESTDAENAMYEKLNHRRSRNKYRTQYYDVPIGNRFVRVQVGSAIPKDISVNALDTVAKYAGRTNTPINVMYGLPEQETGWGQRPWINYGNGVSTTALGNANYFKAFGSIPQEYLVRDFRYNNDLGNASFMIDGEIPPMYHAFEMFNHGDYNRGDKNHTPDVHRVGSSLMSENTGNLKRWWNTEGKKYYNDGLRWRNSPEGVSWRKAHPYKK